MEVEDISQMCIVCREISDFLVYIYSKTPFWLHESEREKKQQQKQLCLADMINECSDCKVKLGDGFPPYMCERCAVSTKAAFRLKRQYEESYPFFAQVIKAEDDLCTMLVKEDWISTDEKSEPREPEKPDDNEMTLGDSTNNATDTSEVTDENDNWENSEPVAARKTQRAKELIGAQKTNRNKKDCVRTNPARKLKKRNCKATKSVKEDRYRDLHNDELKESNEAETETHIYESKLSVQKTKPFQCSFCKKSFAQHQTLKVHIRSHTGERPYQCSQCSKAFPQQSNLDLHMRRHTGERPFQCSQCPKAYKQLANLTAHMCLHTGERPFKCPHCPRDYTQMGHLYLHMDTHALPRFKCGQCRSRFNQKSALQKHMIIHSRPLYKSNK